MVLTHLLCSPQLLKKMTDILTESKEYKEALELIETQRTKLELAFSSEATQRLSELDQISRE